MLRSIVHELGEFLQISKKQFRQQKEGAYYGQCSTTGIYEAYRE